MAIGGAGKMTKKSDQIRAVLDRAKDAAVEYYDLTGKPLGITGEIGEFYAAECLDLELAEARVRCCSLLA